MDSREWTQMDANQSRATGIYVFCFAEAHADVRMEGVRAERFSECAAVVAEVLLEEFAGEQMRDLAWLGPRACRHEEVVEAVMQSSAVLPARFATLFRSADSLRHFLDQHQEKIVTFLRQTAGSAEWGVKAALDQSKPRPPDEQLSALPPGTRYLRQKRSRGADIETLERAASAVAEDLARLACAMVERKPLGGDLHNWAFLVRRQSAEEFCARAREAAIDGLEFSLSGPWPPYSFVPEFP